LIDLELKENYVLAGAKIVGGGDMVGGGGAKMDLPANAPL
jgi:hypothetical protein